MPKARSISKRLQHIRDASEQAKLIGTAIGTANELAEASLILIEQTLFEELLKPAEEREQDWLVKYMTFAQRTREQMLKDKSLMLTEGRQRFKMAETAIKDAGRIREIVDSGEDEPAKIEKVMLLLFGPQPVGFVSTRTEGA